MRMIAILGVVAAAAGAIYLLQDAEGLARWAAEQQRGFQNQMAGALRALKMGQPGALAALFAAAGAYGFVHAAGPGHGKALIGGVGLGSAVSAPRLLAISLTSSLAQALWAIVLVYGGFVLLEISARQMTALAEDWMAPASALAIAAIGLILVWRSIRALLRLARRDQPDGHAQSHADCGCHAHGPAPEEVAKLESLRDTVALVASIAIRPCTGAIFLLVIAWQMEIRAAGAAAVIVMGLGTASLTSLIAVSSVAARGVAFASVGQSTLVPLLASAAQLIVGLLIVWASMALLQFAI